MSKDKFAAGKEHVGELSPLDALENFESEEEIVLVLPLYQCTLEEYLELRSTNISEIEALEIFRKVSLAIDYAHR